MKSPNIYVPSRRAFMKGLGMAAAFYSVRGAFAQELMLTPKQTEGPFYPNRLPLDTDNDLVVVNDDLTPAVGEVTWLSGRILDKRGAPIRNAMVEIWQVDINGSYLHTGSYNLAKRDVHFQGFGRFLTGSSGEYQFRTIKPVPYPGRTPHIHFAVKMRGHEKWTTQCYIQGHPQNEKDSVWRGLHNDAARNAVTVPFAPMTGGRAGELAARFDIVMGYTPQV